MNIYTCPTCGSKMERDLLLFKKHTDDHIVAELKKQNPAWVTDDGYCQPCLDYFISQIRPDGPGKINPAPINIGVAQTRMRRIMSYTMFNLSLFFAVYFFRTDQPKIVRLWVFLPLLGAFLTFFQAQRRVCVFLAASGSQNMDNGPTKVADLAIAKALRRASLKIVFLSAVLSLAIAVALYLI